jgi:DNA-binding transcriptional MerR regulator
MRIAELARTSGVPSATIKWYLRQGLLQRGELTAPNQADYGPQHLRRLRLIRALLEVGGLSVAAAARVTAALDDPSVSLSDVVGIAHGALARAGDVPPGEVANPLVDAFLARRGWIVRPESAARRDLADLLAAMSSLDLSAPDIDARSDAQSLDEALSGLDTYADAIDALAAGEIATLPVGAPRDVVVERVVVGTVLMEQMLGVLRRLAQEHYFEATVRTLPSIPPSPSSAEGAQGARGD